MAYTYKMTSTNVYVGTNDETMADKINNLIKKIHKVINPSSTEDPPDTCTATVSGESTTLKGVVLSDEYRLVISPATSSADVSTGSSAVFAIFYKNVNGNYTSSLTLTGTGNKTLPILHNASNTGVQIKKFEFTDSSDKSRNMEFYEMQAISNGEIYNEGQSAFTVKFAVLKTKDYFSAAESTALAYQSNDISSAPLYFAYLNAGSSSTHSVVFSGGSVYPTGDYAIASGVNLLSNTSSTTMYRHVVDESVLYGIWANGTRLSMNTGASITISGSKFVSISNGYWVRIS